MATEKSVFRHRVWDELIKVAKPDSRFHYDFSMFIPDFEGSEKCVQAIREMEAYRKAKLLFITPDNCLEKLRESAILDKKPFIMPTYGIRRGFILIRRELVPKGKEDFASTLDGAERFGMRISLRDIQRAGRIDLMVTGASIVNTSGVRFGKGHGYFDIEWALMREIGVVDQATPVITVAHDVQVVDAEIPVSPNDTIVDYIVTPTRFIKVSTTKQKPLRIYWDMITEEMLDNIPPLKELKEIKGYT